ncbi:MAG: extracellular solute-binding protein [Chitinophagaceae bacterium]|nr:extracellular solute-binding protein [Oligoflexus sp.]
MSLCFVFLMAILSADAFSAPRILKVAAQESSPYISKFGEERGYFYEIVTRAFADAGYQLDIQFYPSLRATKMVQTGERDILIPSTFTEADAEVLAYSRPLNGSSAGYIKLKNTPDSVLPTHNRVLSGPKTPPVSEDHLQVIGKSNSDKTIQLLDMLNQKRVPYIIADKLVAADVVVSKRPHLVGKLEFVNPPLSQIDFHVAFSKKNPDYKFVLDAFDKALETMKRNGSYEKILIRYGAQTVQETGNTLVIGTVANVDMKLLEELSPQFLKSRPGVHIRWNIIEENLLRKRIFSNIAMNDNAFDIITIGQNETRVYAKKGWIAPLAPTAVSYDVNDLLPFLRKDLSVGGKLFALPFYGESSMTYYRQDLFKAKSLVMPAQPTYSEIRSLASKVHDPKAGVYGICLRGKAGWGENSASITSMVKAFGGRWFDEDWQPQLMSSKWHDAVHFYMDLAKEFGPPDSYRNGYNENLKLFAEGHCGIWIDATVAASFLTDKTHSLVAQSVGFAASPQHKAGLSTNWKWTWAFAISSMSPKKALAQEFMEWATSKEYIDLVAAKRGWLLAPPGTRTSTYKNPKYLSAAPFGKFVYEILTSLPKIASDSRSNAQLVEMDVTEFPALGNAFGSHMSDVMKGKSTVEEALQLSQREVKSIMYHSGYYTNTPAFR